MTSLSYTITRVQAVPTTLIFTTKGELVKSIEGSDYYDTAKYVKLLSQ
jgi:hypothetical protein